MAKSDKRPRQNVVNQSTVAALMGDLPDDNGGGIVEQLAREQAGGDQTLARKTPRRPTEERRRQRQLSITFSVGNKDAAQRLRDLAAEWGIVANNGKLNVSAVVEHLLMPQIEAAEQGKIEPPDPPVSISGKGKNTWF